MQHLIVSMMYYFDATFCRDRSRDLELISGTIAISKRRCFKKFRYRGNQNFVPKIKHPHVQGKECQLALCSINLLYRELSSLWNDIRLIKGRKD
jgi:hypothetical protein